MNWKLFGISLAIVAALSFGLHAVTHMPIWLCFVLILSAMRINGYIADLEDDLPGGFNNLDPSPSETQLRVAKIRKAIARRIRQQEGALNSGGNF